MSVLVVGLGNPLAGDDGVGCHLARRLLAHPGLPRGVEVLEGGTDLLRLEPALEGRERVVLVDALLDAEAPGRLLRFDGELHDLDDRGGSVHAIPPVQALRLLRALNPSIRAVPVTFLGITIDGVAIAPNLSGALADRLDALVEEALAALIEPSTAPPRRHRPLPR